MAERRSLPKTEAPSAADSPSEVTPPPGRQRDEEWLPPRRRASLLRSFNHAFEGLVYVFRRERNMRVHFLVAVLVLFGSLFFQLSRLELIAVFAAITFVLMAEMINTAIEAAVDIITSDFDPRAKVAKDAAAGAVLISAVNALLVAYFVFADKAASLSTNVLASVRRSPTHVTFVTLLLVILVVIVIKATVGRGKALSGGLPSGHAAVAFAGWTAVTFITAGHPYHILVSALTFFMAALTAQSRVESGIHTTLEVVLGALLGAILSTLLFQFLS